MPVENPYQEISKVSLVDLSCPVTHGPEGIQWSPQSPREVICERARVSVPPEIAKGKSGALLDYLADHKHWSPFEMVTAGFLIETPRDISRQILRHRSLHFQEFSQRYADPLKDMGLLWELRQVRTQDHKNRQNSFAEVSEDVLEQAESAQWDALNSSEFAYGVMVDHGVAKEVARVVLPEGLTMSRMYVSGTLRSWIHFCDVRCDPSTQREHREVAEKVRDIVWDILEMSKEED